MCPGSWEGGNKGHRVVRFLRKGMAVGWNIKKCQEQRVCSLSTLQGLALQGTVRLTHSWEGTSKAQASERKAELLRPVPSLREQMRNGLKRCYDLEAAGDLETSFPQGFWFYSSELSESLKIPAQLLVNSQSWFWRQRSSGEDVLKQDYQWDLFPLAYSEHA